MVKQARELGYKGMFFNAATQAAPGDRLRSRLRLERSLRDQELLRLAGLTWLLP